MNDLDPAQRSDQQLAADLAAGDPTALAELAERYAPDLYDFAIRIVLDGSAASIVLEDSFEHARSDIASRSAFLSLRAWLLALVRDNALEALRQRGRADAEPDQAPTPLSLNDPMFVEIDDAEMQEMASWAWQAARGQRPRDYSLLDLALRRQVAPEEIAELAGLSRTGIYGVTGRLRGSFEEAFAATALFYRGLDACSELSSLVGQNSELRPALRRDIARHAETCSECRVTLNNLPLASDLFTALANVGLPSEIEAAIHALRSPDADITGGVPLAMAAAGVVAERDELEETVDLDLPAIRQRDLLATGSPDDEPEDAIAEEEDEYEDEDEYVEEPDTQPVANADEARRPVPLRFTRSPAAAGGTAAAPTERIRFERQDLYASSPGGAGGGIGGTLNALSGGRGVWFLALLLGITLIAGYVGVAVGDSISGGGDDSSGLSALPTRAGGARSLACGSGPLTVDQGSSATLSLDPKALNGYTVSGVTVQPVTQGAPPNAVVARTQGATNVVFEALAVPTTSPVNEYRLSVQLSRGSDRVVSDCTVIVRSAAAAPGATATRPAAAGTPAPAGTGTVTAPAPGSSATRVP
jgi:DNA-directed RNA polymerase specialized sigma24 family protein